MLSLANAADVFRANIFWAVAINVPIAFAAYTFRTVSRSGLIAGMIYGITIYSFGGHPAFFLLLFFFLVGTGVTKIGRARKEAIGLDDRTEGLRGAGSVLGKCTPGAFLAVLIGMSGGLDSSVIANWFALAYAGAFGAALADTCSSELGPLYGDRPMLLTTLEIVPHGSPGAVSVAGTILGLAGAMLLGLIATILGLIQERAILYIVISSFCASVLESYIRAKRPGTEFLTKQLPNLLHTTVGALSVVLLALLLGY